MKKTKADIIITSVSVFAIMILASCANSAVNVQDVIDKYCLLNKKEHNAASAIERKTAAAQKQAYEKEVDAKYFGDNKTYQIILDGMKKCDEVFVGNRPPQSSYINNTDIDVASAYGDAVSVANHYCELTNQAIVASKNNNDADLKKTVATKVMFEHNMENSYKNNAARRDSILKLIKPCMAKEVQLQQNNE